MKYLAIFLLFTKLLFAEKITVTADNFEAYENKKISILKGHVHIQKGNDDIKANKLVIEFNKSNKPLKYTLTGGVKFQIHTATQNFTGSAHKIVYDPSKKRYIASGSVLIKEKLSDKILQGEKIVIDRISGKSIITGKKNRPVKFTFTVDEE